MRILTTVLLGVVGLWALDIDLSLPSTLLATVYGSGAGEYCGTDIETGDLNGDGLMDLVFNAPKANSDMGRVYIIFGGSGFGGDYQMTADADVVINGVDLLDNIFEIAVADFNGDGMDDLLAGVSNGDGLGNSYTNAGEAYVVYGRTSWPSSLSLSSADVYIYGTEMSGGDPDGSGFVGSMVAAPDLNGDGYADIALAGTGINYGTRTDAGATFVIYGSASLPATIALPGGADAIFYDPDSYDMHYYTGSQYLFRGHTFSQGNLNGDSYDDLVIGLYLGDGPGNARADAGELHIILGSASLSGSYDLASWSHPVIYGAEAGDWFSRSFVGDADGDGVDDILVNAAAADGPGNARADAGEIYLIQGRTSWPASLDMATGDYRCVFYGPEAGDWMDISAIGDATGSGSSDILVGAVQSDGSSNARPNSGELFLIPYSDTLSPGIDLLDYTPLVHIYGAVSNDMIGLYSACLVGDPDADSRPNIIIGAAASTRSGMTNNGQVFVLAYPQELGSREEASRKDFRLVPRPGGFLLVLPPGEALARAYDVSGRLVAEARPRGGRWEVRGLAPGVYMVKVEGLGNGKVLVR